MKSRSKDNKLARTLMKKTKEAVTAWLKTSNQSLPLTVAILWLTTASILSIKICSRVKVKVSLNHLEILLVSETKTNFKKEIR